LNKRSSDAELLQLARRAAADASEGTRPSSRRRTRFPSSFRDASHTSTALATGTLIAYFPFMSSSEAWNTVHEMVREFSASLPRLILALVIALFF
jgi:hypothetical protein